MGWLRTFGMIAICLLLALKGVGQGYLEFVENKGQWDSRIRFKGEMNGGAFMLQNNGYRVLLHNKRDMAAIHKDAHAEPDAHTGGKAGAFKVNADAHYLPVPENGGGGNTGGNNGGGKDDGYTPGIVRSHIYEVRFLNANPDAVAVPEKALPGYNNYLIGNDSTKWASNCRVYQAVTFLNMYPGIDVRYYTNAGLLKYDLIVHPGADLSRVMLYFDGVDELSLSKGNLIVKTSVDNVTENAPYSYQLINGQRKEIRSRFVLNGKIVTFKLDSYTSDATLVIDPSLVFSTFTGSTSDNWGYTATYDGRGNFYAGGIVFGSRFPVSNGAFQTNYGGGSNNTCEPNNGFDIGIMKFNPAGTARVYATYIGGSGNEQPHSLVVDAQGNLVIGGRTSSTDYPLRGALQRYGPQGGLWDIVVTKLNANGTGLVSSVRVGGSGNDGVNVRAKYCAPQGAETIRRNYGDDARSEVILDPAGNVYLASCSQSDDFPVTSHSLQTSLGGVTNGRAQDAVIMKFTPDLSAVLFSVLIGGSADDAAFVLALNPTNGHVFAAGATASSNFPGPKNGVINATYMGGNADGFIVELTADGTLVKTTFLGTAGIDMIYGIQFDNSGFPYVTGTTTGNWPVVNAAFSQAGSKQFIAKLQPDLSAFVYSTIYGSASSQPNISPIAFLVDRCENVYVSGWGGGLNQENGYPSGFTREMTITPDAFQKTTDGSDFYFFVLAKNASSQLYGSYFGQSGGLGEHVDGGTSRFDANGVIYQALCANCNGGGRFPTTPGAWSETNGSSACNLAAVKMAFNLAGVGAGLAASISGVRDTSGCVPVEVVFTDTLAQGKQYVWDFGDGSPAVTTTVPTINHTFNSVGFYRVQLVSIDPDACNVSDTSYLTIRVRNDRATINYTATKLAPCTSMSYEFNNISTAIKPFQSNSFRWDFGDGTTQLAGLGPVTHTYSAIGTYNVKLILIDTNYCNEPDSLIQQVRLSPNVVASFNTASYGCAPFTAVFENTSLGGTDFRWDFGDGTTSTETEPTHVYTTPGTYQVRLIAIDPLSCNERDTSNYFTITVSPNPTAQFVFSPNPPEVNTAVTFDNQSVGGNTYYWRFGDGGTLTTLRQDTLVQHLYNASDDYTACLIAVNNYGCEDTTCQRISIVIVDGADVPNAFTPNGDGQNDRIYVRGYGIAKMSWSIYNRWGVLVFHTTNPADGWDGTYKGVPQPQDVYHYTLQIEFSGKELMTKKGDITLLR